MGPDEGRAAAELRKLDAETSKLEAESEKLEAEARKLRHSTTTDYAKLALAVFATGIAALKVVESLGWL